MIITIYTTKTRSQVTPADIMTSVKESHSLSNKCIEMQQEIAIIESELAELNEENRELRAQLAKLDRAVYT